MRLFAEKPAKKQLWGDSPNLIRIAPSGHPNISEYHAALRQFLDSYHSDAFGYHWDYVCMKKMTKREKRMARHRRVRSRIRGSADCPRLSIFRSGRALTVQLIDDAAGRTLVAVRDSEVPDPEGKKKYTRVERAHAAGALAAHRALQKGIAAVVFDRGGYAYHGLVRSVAEGARKGGLKL